MCVWGGGVKNIEVVLLRECAIRRYTAVCNTTKTEALWGFRKIAKREYFIPHVCPSVFFENLSRKFKFY